MHVLFSIFYHFCLLEHRHKITTETKVLGGDIEQKNEKLTGILVDNAMDLVEKVIPEIEDDLAIKYFGELQKECFATPRNI